MIGMLNITNFTISRSVIFVFGFIIGLLFVSHVVAAQEKSPNRIAENIVKIDQLYSNNNAVREQEFIELSKDVVSNRDLYPSNTLAKVYALLAELETNKADIAKAFQFARDGLSLSPIDVAIELKLLQNLARGYYTNGQFNKTLQVAEQAIAKANAPDHLKFLLVALSYRAMAHALLTHFELANEDLRRVEQLIEAQPQFSSHIDLLEILAIAHHHLGDFQVSVAMQTQVISMKLASTRDINITKNYYSLAVGYEALEKYDDAYNAFWQAEKTIKEQSNSLRLAYIKLGMGRMLQTQGKDKDAYEQLNIAKSIFNGKNQNKPYLSTLIYLAKASLGTGKEQQAEELFLLAEIIAQEVDLTITQIELYKELYLMFQRKGQFEKALAYSSRYLELYQQFHPQTQSNKNKKKSVNETSDRSKEFANRLVESGNLKSENEKNTQSQQQVILLLATVLICLFLLVVFIAFKFRALHLTTKYNDSELPEYFLYSPAQTKDLYQLNYKKARKYNYPIAIGYIMISNWKELTFTVSNKVVEEISRTVAILLNQSLNEFNLAGQLNEGQYLILCPHQTDDEIEEQLNALSSALSTRFFANLGEINIKIEFSYGSPSIQDIDPYIFLSRLSEQVGTKFSN